MYPFRHQRYVSLANMRERAAKAGFRIELWEELPDTFEVMTDLRGYLFGRNKARDGSVGGVFRKPSAEVDDR